MWRVMWCISLSHMIYGLMLKLEISFVESILFLIRAVIQILSTSLIVLNHVKLLHAALIS